MTIAKSPPKKKDTPIRRDSLYASTQSRFASAKLIQNLGCSNPGVQFEFVSKLRVAYGRD